MKQYAAEAIIIILLSAIYIIPALSTFTTADSNLYIDAGKHLILEKRPVLCFDIYQATPDRCMPSLPYIPPLWPIIAGLILSIGGLKAISVFNASIVIASAILLFRIAKETIAIGWALTAVMLAYTSMPMLLISTYPWTESLGLFLINLTIYILISQSPNPSSKKSYIAAIIIGLIFLTRPPYFFPAILIGLLLTDRAKRIGFIVSSLTIPALYEAFCITKYRTIYPQIYINISNYAGLFHNPVHFNLSKALIDIIKTLTQLLLNPISILFLASLIAITYRKNIRRIPLITKKIIATAILLFLTYPSLLIIRSIREIIHAIAH